jgi:predicted metal-dependent hydrolase
MGILSFRRKRQRQAAQLPITPQRMGFTFDQSVPRYWFANDPLLTHFMNVFSLTFPDGEQFFVDSVRALRDQVQDPARQKDISGFIGQEAMHSLEHKRFNQHLATQGYQAVTDEATKVAYGMIGFARKHFSPQHQLAATAGLEHLTAILANAVLADKKFVSEIDPSMRALWVWHAIEETEHKAVAFDLYQDTVGSYALRVSVFLRASLALSVFMSRYTYKMLEADGLHRSPRVIAKGLWHMFGVNGFFTRVIPDYVDYLRPGFHPWDDDNSALIAQWKGFVEAQIAPQYQKGGLRAA